MSGWGTIYNLTTRSMTVYSQTLARLHEQSASGMRVVRASDDPNSAYRILSLRSISSQTQSHQKNLEDVDSRLGDASSALEAVSDIMARVRELLTQASSGTYTQSNRVPIGHEINSLLEQAVSMANVTNMGRHLFGGAALSQPPYDVTKHNGQITSVAYQGSYNNLDVTVAPGVTMSSTLVGDGVFRNASRGSAQFLGHTGAAAGSGTSSVRGDVWLTVAHTATTFGGSLGLAAGSASADGDTIMGDHQLTVDAVNGTICLGGGPAVAFDGSETNLRLTTAAGDVLYVDTTGWTGGSGTENVTSAGKMSIDDGATWTALAGGGEQTVTHGVSGQSLQVDTSCIVRTGIDPIRAEGTYDLFNTLVGIRDLLLNTRGLDDGEQIDLLRQQINSVEEVTQGITSSLTAVGGKIQALDNLRTNLKQIKDSSDDQANALQDADIIQVATDLARTQTLYEMTLTSASKLLRLSLLDYI